MINHYDENVNTENKIFTAIKHLGIAKLLRSSNISKSRGVPIFDVFTFLVLLVFEGKNLFRFLNSKDKQKANSKNTYYRFLSNNSYNWIKFLSLLSFKVAFLI